MRELEAKLAARQRSVDLLQVEIERLRAKLAAGASWLPRLSIGHPADNLTVCSDQARLGAQRTILADRQAMLATLEAAPLATLPRALLELQLRSPDPYAPALLQTRQVLLSELLQVFNVRVYADDSDDDDDDDEDDDDEEEEDDFFKRSEGEEVSPPAAPAESSGGRRQLGGRGRGEWMIANGLVVPLPGDIHRTLATAIGTLASDSVVDYPPPSRSPVYPAEQTNAALSATLHLLSLFATYLSPPLGLPFVPFLRPPSLQPSARFSPNPLAATPDLAALLARHSARGVFPLQVPQRQPDLLLAGLAALQFDVAFLAAHVGVEIPLNESGLLLYNLYRIALELGSPVTARSAVTVGGRVQVEAVSLQRIALSLRGTLASSSSGAHPSAIGDFGGGGGPSTDRSRSEQRRAEAKDARRQAKDAVKSTETAEERDERRTRRRAKRAERERRLKERDDWELVAGDSLESIRRG